MAQSGAYTARERDSVWDESRDFGFEWRTQRREPRRARHETAELREPRRPGHETAELREPRRARHETAELREPRLPARPRADEPSRRVPREAAHPADATAPSRRRSSATHRPPRVTDPAAVRSASADRVALAALAERGASDHIAADGVALAAPGERRTVVIRGRGDDRLYGVRSRRRPSVPRHERSGFRADRTAMWAVILGIAMLLIAAMSAHGAVIPGH